MSVHPLMEFLDCRNHGNHTAANRPGAAVRMVQLVETTGAIGANVDFVHARLRKQGGIDLLEVDVAAAVGGRGDMGGGEFAPPAAVGGMGAFEGGLGAPMGGGLGSSMGGNEFDIQQGPTNIDKQKPLTDEVPF